MNLEIASIALFFGIIIGLVLLDRKNIEFGIVLIRRTKAGREQIKAFAEKHRKFFKIFGSVAIVLAIVLSIFGLVYLAKFQSGVRLVLPKIFPGEASEGVKKVVFFVPLWYWVIGLFVILIPHELFHGFLFAVEKIKIKSTGLLLFLIFPGGFVEPDEEQFKKSSPKTRMKVAAVGSIANICVALILIIITVLWGVLGNALYQSVGVNFEGTIPDTPAAAANMKGMIKEINGIQITSVKDLTLVLNGISPGQNVRVLTTEAEYSFATIPSPDNSSLSFIGISNVSNELEYKAGVGFLGNAKSSVSVYSWFSDLFGWLIMLDISIAVANLLPFLPFDGGVIWQAVFEKFTKNRKLAEKMIKVLSALTYALLVINLLGLKIFA